MRLSEERQNAKTETAAKQGRQCCSTDRKTDNTPKSPSIHPVLGGLQLQCLPAFLSDLSSDVGAYCAADSICQASSLLLRSRRSPTSINAIDAETVIVAMAAISGEMPSRSIDQMCIGSVLSAPVRKKAMAISSNDRVNTNNALPRIAVRMFGSVIRKKVCHRLAPRSALASSRRRSKRRSRA